MQVMAHSCWQRLPWSCRCSVAGDFRDHRVDGWPMQMMSMPVGWYIDVNESAGIEYPVNGDETAQRKDGQLW
ncbi:hypothetical protein SEA_DECURRO_3 [Arthrobacter phage Decurro]|uniref:Uncharacterized protein n=23 Tax=Decurrovirus decurro TaxID=1982105 RepID=A0A0U4IMW7_9CAUD|nr:hypothetical protein SEA_DECURRO_3 [Arthrobacter phage Decurro]ALJ97687.1 hypothetical protein SEA_TYMABREU_3 [Arthrobacter phage TymAbreu]ALM23551.1 hypothetical protein SEA_JESSICA_4 [Arthrobacter phage Jessica]ALY09630.1 hypothetical protein MAGGIE_3 [Arthrobacter phage Maggie]ALY09759.1 hypothetical protein MUTTLIE_3 [Arthrobacter phage Muttlie]ANZ52292.1 hypothetical protein SEA_COURTNEY3_3 [Arthrobacter phage Courtney3]AOQ28337.1 hypothetical protein SEA_MASSIMO_3 [Arthrobacter phage